MYVYVYCNVSCFFFSIFAFLVSTTKIVSGFKRLFGCFLSVTIVLKKRKNVLEPSITILLPVNGLQLKENACDFAKVLGVSNFQASDGWLEKWKKRLAVFNLYIFPIYKNVSNCSFNNLMIFSSAVNCKVQGTFIPFPLPWLTGFPQTTAIQSLFSLAFKK